MLLNLWRSIEAKHRTILFVTHDVDEALILADRILVIVNGRTVDDLPATLPRPRTTDSLIVPEAVRHKHVLLAHLGLEEGAPAEAVATAASGAG